MSKKLKWPVAKIREDKCPAVWLTWGVWQAIRGGLVNTYLNARESHARSEARIAAHKRDDILDTWRADKSDAEHALELYRLGWAYNHPKNENSDLFKTPTTLIELGDKLEAKAYAEETEALREGPPIVRDEAGRAWFEQSGTFHPITGDGRARSRWELKLARQ